MSVYQWLLNMFETCSGRINLSPRSTMPSRRRGRCVPRCVAFILGFTLGQLYYLYLLKKIPFLKETGFIISLTLSLLLGATKCSKKVVFPLGLGNVMCMQLRCISLLSLPMYCGKPGRAVLKAVVLTCVIAGPITNMGRNAKEVVRVFACSTQLAHNLSDEKHELMDAPFKRALFTMSEDMSQIKDTMSSVRDVITPIEIEIEDYEVRNTLVQNSNSNQGPRRINNCSKVEQEERAFYLNHYNIKIENRCKEHLSRAVALCTDVFASVYGQCLDAIPKCSSWVLCRPLKLDHICNLEKIFAELNICDSEKQTNPGLGEGYVALKKVKSILASNKGVALQYKINAVRELYDFQDAKETGDRVMHAFEEKYLILKYVTTAVDLFVALLFLRIFSAAITYHDEYLTDIDYDNVYITRRFKRIDHKRRKRDQCTLLPLKKMERSKYVDVNSMKYTWSDRNKLITHILKLMLEVITATTFVMLDRLFYEALDVVRQHAQIELPREDTRDLEIKVEGTGNIANMVRKVLSSLNTPGQGRQAASNQPCLPRPRLIPYSFYIKIYGGYLWILFLLYINPYTVRLKRWTCSYFYPCREKQRILHLYNDILKKRMKMRKTLRRKAVQAVRAHYLSGENLLSLRMKFPRLLGWLRVLPAARMTCLICGETEPRKVVGAQIPEENWHSCKMSKCPFVYCVECWREVGARCLACDPSLAELSDIDSLSENELKQS